MAKYLDFSYLEDTYGERVRDSVPIRMVDLGYEIDGAGDPVANVMVEVGPISWNTTRPKGYPSGSRVAVMRSYNFYPPNPDRFLEEAKYNPVDDTTEFLYRNNGSMIMDENLESGEVLSFRSGTEPLGVVRPNSVLYIAVYISEPFIDSSGRTIWLPWDLRGQAHLVVPGNFGGVEAGINALPRGVMTSGLIYGEHIDNPLHALMKSFGYLVDTIITNGEMIIDAPESLHPNIVVPLLRGMGMSTEEEGFFTDRTVRHRLKNILYRYRMISASKGTMAALSWYVEAATGLESLVAGPLNYLLDRSDTCPDNPHVDKADLSVSASAQWELVPSIGYEDGYTGSETPLYPPIAGLKADGVTLDPWFDEKNDTPAASWVHRIWPGSFGSRRVVGAHVPAYMAVIEPGHFYNLRFRFNPVLAGDAFGTLFFYDVSGALISNVAGTAVAGTPGQWNDWTGELVLAPAGARYLAWQIDVTQVSSLGAIQVSEGNIPAKYRNPRSIAVVLKTGQVPVRDSWVTMDSPVVAMNDGNVKMDDGRYYGTDTTVDSFERVLIAKMRATLDRYLMPGVDVHVITADDIEFTRFWPNDYT